MFNIGSHCLNAFRLMSSRSTASTKRTHRAQDCTAASTFARRANQSQSGAAPRIAVHFTLEQAGEARGL